MLPYIAPPPRRPDRTPVHRVIHYIWCSEHGKRTFQFRHFLSLRSAIHHLDADQINMYLTEWPTIDRYWYNTWLYELQVTYPFIRFITRFSAEMCSPSGLPDFYFIARLLAERGGVYLNENITLTEFSPKLLYSSLTYKSPVDKSLALRTAVSLVENQTLQQWSGTPDRLRCVLPEEFGQLNTSACLDLSQMQGIHPKDLWTTSDHFSISMRQVMYGSANKVKPVRHTYDVIPRIAHYIWFGEDPMTYMFFVSVLSCLHIANLNTVYIHGDHHPSGEYWGKLQGDNRVRWIFRARPAMVYGIQLNHVAHEADVIAADVIIKHGGVHVDPDVIFTRSLSTSSLWQYEAVAAPSQTDMEGFPNIINYGLFMGARGAKFWRHVQSVQREFRARQWNWNSARAVYKVYERNPDLLYVTPYLQVMCYKGECIPRWTRTREEGRLWNQNITTWMNMTYALHFTDPTPHELTHINVTITSQSHFAQFVRKILTISGII